MPKRLVTHWQLLEHFNYGKTDTGYGALFKRHRFDVFNIRNNSTLITKKEVYQEKFE